MGSIDHDDDDDNNGSISVANISVTGMTCSSCVMGLEQALKRVDGIRKVDVSLMAAKARIEYDRSIVSVDQLIESVECVGYDAKLIDNLQRHHSSAEQELVVVDRLREEGSYCTSTTTTIIEIHSFMQSNVSIDDALSGISGIVSFNRLNATNKRNSSDCCTAASFNISYDQKKVGMRRIIAALWEQGFKCTQTPIDNHYTRLKKMQEAEVQMWKSAFATSALFGIPSMFTMFVFMFAVGHEQIPTVIPGLGLDNIIMFMLASPVQYLVGKYFLRTAYGSIRYARSANMDVLVCMASTVAYVYSVVDVAVSVLMANFAQRPPINPITFFDVTPMLLMFVSLGRWLENIAKGKTSEALTKLISLQPTEGLVLIESKNGENNPFLQTYQITPQSYFEHDENGKQCYGFVMRSDLIECGDLLKILPGMKVPVDGVLRVFQRTKSVLQI